MLDITRKTGLQVEIDELIARLVAMRQREVCRSQIFDDNAQDLRALAGLLKDASAAIDPLFQRIAYEAGRGSMSGASSYAGIVSNIIEGDLLFEINERANELAVERAPADAAREHSTLNHAMQGI